MVFFMILWPLSHSSLHIFKSKEAIHDFVTIPVLNSSCGALCHRTLTDLWPSTVVADGKQDLDNTALAQGPASFKTQPPVVAMTKLTELTSSQGQEDPHSSVTCTVASVTSVNFSLFTFSERFRE